MREFDSLDNSDVSPFPMYNLVGATQVKKEENKALAKATYPRGIVIIA